MYISKGVVESGASYSLYGTKNIEDPTNNGPIYATV